MALADIYAALQSGQGAARADVADLMRQEALRSPVAFATFLRGVALNDACALFEVYEILLQDSQRFSAILTSELARLLHAAKVEPHNAAIYAQLDAFALAQDGEMKESMAAVLAESLRSDTPQIRRFAADLAGDCIGSGDSALVSQLRTLQAQDPDWRVRLLAHSSLKDLEAQRPSGDSLATLRVADRLRGYLLGARVREYAA